MKNFTKTSDTLKFISTHVINSHVIREYVKLCNSGDDVILCIDNSNVTIESDSPICELEFFGKKVKCFLFDANTQKKLKLPNYYYSLVSDYFERIMWYNSDYRFYFVHEYFPDYKYYWQFEYDVYFNGLFYSLFFDKYKKRTTDLLVCNFRGELINSGWCWTNKINWLYDKSIDLYGCFFPICRMTNEAISYLYNKRIEYGKKFKKFVGRDGYEWPFCELFVTTELMNAGFKCNSIVEEHVNLGRYYPNDDCFKLRDNLLYHKYISE